jgi:hypothetical protein
MAGLTKYIGSTAVALIAFLSFSVSIGAGGARAQSTDPLPHSFVTAQLAISKNDANAMAMLKHCGRSDLMQRYVKARAAALANCGATAEQQKKIMAPLASNLPNRGCARIAVTVEATEKALKKIEDDAKVFAAAKALGVRVSCK